MLDDSEIQRILVIAAHPDDENTQLITYLARGREYRMAYLSVTRGDGGQNVLGGEFSSELGLIRTEELLAARRLARARHRRRRVDVDRRGDAQRRGREVVAGADMEAVAVVLDHRGALKGGDGGRKLHARRRMPVRPLDREDVRQGGARGGCGRRAAGT